MQADLAPLADLVRSTRAAHTAHTARLRALATLPQNLGAHQIMNLIRSTDADRAELNRLWEELRLTTTVFAEAARGYTDNDGRPVVIGVPSHSRPGLVHHLVHLDNEWICPCEGYSQHGHCRHQDEADQALAASTP